MTDYGMKRLSKIPSYLEIGSPSAAIRRGMHCPLFGCTVLMRHMEKTAFLIVGTDKCGFYSKEILKVLDGDYMKAPLYIYALNESDVIFGCEDKLSDTLRLVCKKERPEIIYIISTCVTYYLIGEDMEGLVKKMEAELPAKLLYVNAHNFKQNSHVDGMRDMLSKFSSLMSAAPQRTGVNLLGDRESKITGTELGKYLEKHGVKINLVLPGRLSLCDIERSGGARLNIVLDSIGLDLVREMEKLGIPYIVFGKYARPERILAAYRQLETLLGLDPDPELESWAAETDKKRARLAEFTPKRQFALISFDVCLKLQALDFDILACFVISYNDMERELFSEWKSSGADPLVSLLTDFSRTEELNAALRPAVYIGRSYADKLRAMGIAMASPETAIKETGFELSNAVADLLYLAMKEVEEMR